MKQLYYLRGTERLIDYADSESDLRNLANYRRARNDGIARIEEFAKEYLTGLQKLRQLPKETQKIIIERVAGMMGYNEETNRWWEDVLYRDLEMPPDSFVEGAWAEKVGKQIERQGNYKFER